MTLQEIKTAVDNGETVYFSNLNYKVQFSEVLNRYSIVCESNGHITPLHRADVLNGEENQFFTLPEGISAEQFQTEQRLKREVLTAMSKLEDYWNSIDGETTLNKDYPFHLSFEDLMDEVQKWANTKI